MTSAEFDREGLEATLANTGFEFEHRATSETAEADDVREQWVYAAPLDRGFQVVLQLLVVPDRVDAEYHRDQELTVFLAHENDPDRYLAEVTSMPLMSEWKDHLKTQADKAADRITDLEHCEECDLPMLKYTDYAGEFYACVSFDCENIVELEPMDQRAEGE